MSFTARKNELPRRKQRVSRPESKNLFAASRGELDPRRLNIPIMPEEGRSSMELEHR